MLSMCFGGGGKQKQAKAAEKPPVPSDKVQPAPQRKPSIGQKNGSVDDGIAQVSAERSDAPLPTSASNNGEMSDVATSAVSQAAIAGDTVADSRWPYGGEDAVDSMQVHVSQPRDNSEDSSSMMREPGPPDDAALGALAHMQYPYDGPPPTKVLAPKYSTLDATLDFVCALVEHLGGRFSEAYTILHDQPVRKCMFCIQCRAQANSGSKIVDVLFFPNDDDFKAQRRICGKRPLQEYQPRLEAAQPATDWMDRESGVLVRLPSLIVTEATMPMDDVLLHMDAITRQSTMCVIARELASQLVVLHSKRVVHRGITRGNVVQLAANSSVVWTFREYCCYVTEGKSPPMDQSTSQLLILPPEAAVAVRNMTPSLVMPCMDIWQLGVLMFEMFAGQPYWPGGMSARDVVAALLTPGLLPHEADPSKVAAVGQDAAATSLAPKLKAVRALIMRMLDRNGAARPDAVNVKKELSFSALERTVADGTLNLPWSRGVVAIGF